MSCLFCNIVEGKIPASKVYEDDSLVAFEAPVSSNDTEFVPARREEAAIAPTGRLR